MNKLIIAITIAILSLLVSACSKSLPKEGRERISKKDILLEYDADVKLSRSEFKAAMLEPEGRIKKDQEIISDTQNKRNQVPDFQELLRTPNPPSVAPEKLISLSITEDVPLKAVLIELSRLAGVELELDPYISGGIILMVKDRPFDEVMKKIADMANLRYSVSDGLLKIEMDYPYIVNYGMKFLDMTRTNSTSLAITTTTGNDDLSSGGSTSISTTSESDVWTTVEENIQRVLDSNDENTITSVSNEGTKSSEDLGTQFVSINKQAGIVSVKTSSKVHKQIEEYLSMIKKSLTSQVLIEAKIVEVTLDDRFETGIEWSNIPEVSQANFNKIGSDETFFGVDISGIGSGNFDAALSMLDAFGTTRTLSSPRIAALNNQQSVLSFTENKIYFEVEYDEETITSDSTSTSTGIESTMSTLPIGIIVTMLPSIDFESNSVTLNIRPTISSSSSGVSDPAVELISLQLSDSSDTVTSEIPEVSVKEIDTVLNIKDKQIIVMGGLIDQTNDISESGIPFLQDIPFLGYLFKSYSNETSAKETVLFIKATIITNESEVDAYDKGFYKTFTTDPRPLIF